MIKLFSEPVHPFLLANSGSALRHCFSGTPQMAAPLLLTLLAGRLSSPLLRPSHSFKRSHLSVSPSHPVPSPQRFWHCSCHVLSPSSPTKRSRQRLLLTPLNSALQCSEQSPPVSLSSWTLSFPITVSPSHSQTTDFSSPLTKPGTPTPGSLESHHCAGVSFPFA